MKMSPLYVCIKHHSQRKVAKSREASNAVHTNTERAIRDALELIGPVRFVVLGGPSV
jgi:hypothetical protein